SWITALLHYDVHRKFHAAEIPVIRVDPLDERVARVRHIHQRLHVLDQILRVDGSLDVVLAERAERHDLLAVFAGCLRRGGICSGAFEEAMWREPHAHRAHVGAAIRGLVIGHLSWGWTDAALKGLRVVSAYAASARWL